MLDAIYASFSALQGQQTRIESLSADLANVATPAYKKTRLVFEALAPGGGEGLGTRLLSRGAVFTQGELRETDRSLDLAIRGDGFLELELPDGTAAYTRVGSLSLSPDGTIESADGLPVAGNVRVPPDAISLAIDSAGELRAQLPDEAGPVSLGSLPIARFANPEGLRELRGGLYVATEASGPASSGAAGEQGRGRIVQGFLETANVDFAESLVDLTLAQRAYQLNARALQAADEVLGEINGLRR